MDRKKAFVRLIVMVLESVIITSVVWIVNEGIYDNIEIALWRIPIFLIGAYVGERLYEGDEFNKGDGVIFAGGAVLKILACVCTFGMLIGKFTLPNIFRSRVAISIFL